LLWIVVSSLVNEPGLVKSVMALVPVDMSSVSVGVSVNIKASNTDISDVSSGSVEPSDLLDQFTSVLSDNSSVVVVVIVVSSYLDRDRLSGVRSRSNSSCSPVEDEPLLVIVWVVVLDSESVLV